ncbi:MAG: hypothetical protein JJ975_12105 [Bacteroidia bacterium]|nr:hypothetical protein [Bacteroidia bacterium]
MNLILTPQSDFTFRSEDVWDLTVTNVGSEAIRFQLEALVTNNQGEVVRLRSEPISCDPGSMTFNRSTLGTVSKLYKSEDAANYEALTGELPPNDYTYCIDLICLDEACRLAVGPESRLRVCQTVKKETTTPLLLSIPRDESVIDNKRPDFTWIAPMPIGSDPNISYSITLVELQDGQSPEDGLKRNRALYKQSGVKGTTLVFPAELDDLIEEHRYGWQVEAWLGNTFIAISDAWEFEIGKETEVVQGMPYVRLKKQIDGIYNAVNKLKFIYDEPLKENALNIRFYDHRGKDVTPPDLVFATHFGENKFTLDIRQFDLVPNDQYKMVITAPNGEEYSLKFKYIFQFTE